MRIRALMSAGAWLLMLTLAVPSLLAAEDAYDLRSVKWGMSREDVVKSEGKKPILDKDNMLVFKDTLFGNQIHVMYIFADSKLCKAMYFLADEHTNKNDYIDDYDVFKETLDSKYGTPKDSRVLWKNELYAKDKEFYGQAISLGYLEMISIWETPTTRIACVLDGENFNVQLKVIYDSKEFIDLLKKENEKKEKSKF
ncbi:hypothetical protein G3N56_19495 [Desulfovibrio sulfodismutans]|uniref:Uncharacterized protein n=1 Tax=Desulfolutivibrio sulfodismutans TaxID=63561 RepID=A0A7K3NRV8_9BACT|nr:hypothetical protein [Desulfolutivibrio sulfodismutans]NDY58926.1 hypothetical protein [Desulfolutivibrio sulfodismutans]QLA13559.1 hypothetical protein GD606_15440 [Desulfolutivibrio sulfodismutans DSM 3696]